MITCHNPVIVCGSGPSLQDVWPMPIYDTGLPIAVVSTAIRLLYLPGWPKPDYWLFIDSLSTHHGKEGKSCLRDPAVKKVVPKSRYKYFKQGQNVECCNRHGTDAAFMQEDRDGVAKVMNRSMTFAIQWLMKFGHHDVLIFAGMDLKSTAKAPYAHDGKLRRRVDIHNQQHVRELRYLKKWAAQVGEYGVTWLCWSNGSPLANFMETWSGHTRRHRKDARPARPLPRAHHEPVAK